MVKFDASLSSAVLDSHSTTSAGGLAQTIAQPFRHHAVIWLEVRPHLQRGAAITPLIIGRPSDRKVLDGEDDDDDAVPSKDADPISTEHAIDNDADVLAPLLERTVQSDQRGYAVQDSNKGTVPDMQWRAVTLPTSLRPSLYVHPFLKHQQFVL